METGLRFKVSSERPEKREIDLAIPGMHTLYTLITSSVSLNSTYVGLKETWVVILALHV